MSPRRDAGSFAAMSDRLQRYREKRRPSSTPEPGLEPGGKRAPGWRRGPKAPRFVIQKHAATSLHYDFRLEVDDTLRSWAVPKGPSTDPRVKRLAVEVEDHPLEYADFEGRIGTGNYGAGAVIVWDTGNYRNLDEEQSMADAIDAGHVKFWLEGEKLIGGWTLQRTRRGAKPQWLLIKRRDEFADARRNPESTQPESVKSGRTLEDVADDQGESE
jgi:DNA ligase D-like protein (predicted 3'-phosphoesterase)